MCSQAFMARGGQFTISDDSHGINHVGTNYSRLLMFIENTKICPVVFFEKGSPTKDIRFPGITTKIVSLAKIKEHPIFA